MQFKSSPNQDELILEINVVTQLKTCKAHQTPPVYRYKEIVAAIVETELV